MLENFVDNKNKIVKQTVVKKVDIDDIVSNQHNIYSIEAIDELKESIKMYGLKHNITVYEADENDNYVIESGHRRFTALKQLHDEGLIDDEIPVNVVSFEDNQLQRKLDIILSNAQRNLTEEDKLEIVKALLNIYEELVEKPKGQKRDWIAQFLGCTGRTAQQYINKFEENEEGEYEEKTEETVENEKIEESYDLNRVLKEFKSIQKKFEKMSEKVEEVELDNYVISQNDKQFVTLQSAIDVEVRNITAIVNKITDQLTKE